MAKIDFTGLVPEFFSNEPTWMDFLEALADTIQEQIRDPIQEIEDIRHIVEDTDPEVIARTIKNLGFDLPADLIAHNAERLSKSVYMLSLFHERSGTSDFVKGVKFVLGRDISVHSLYTEDYVSFYSRPQGPLLKDGGSWYKTTHVDLGMELLQSDTNLILPVGKTLADRLMDAYFEFAPINHVVREFYYLVNMQATVYFGSRLVVSPRDIIHIGLGGDTLSYVNPLLPTTVSAGSALLVYSDLVYSQMGCYPVSNPRYGFANAGLDANSNIKAFLPVSLPNTQNAPIVLDNDGRFAYFAHPSALGTATFRDPVTGISGGWDGATWPPSGAVGNTSGPLTVTIEEDGQEEEWYLYRTDFPFTGTRTFQVEFEYQGLRNTCDTPIPSFAVREPVEIEDSYLEPEPEEPCFADTRPVYGAYRAGLNADSQLEFLPNKLDPFASRFTVDAEPDSYVYFAYPAALGKAAFVDVSSGMSGGWGGATWGDSPELNLDPIVVVRQLCGQAQEWFVYRTETPGIQNRTFDVEFDVAPTEEPIEPEPSPEEPDTNTPKCISGYPTFYVGDKGDIVEALLSEDAYVYGSTETLIVGGNIEEGEYGWLAYPIEMGIATITEVNSGRTDLWRGASWATSEPESTSGPIVIQRIIKGKVYDWFLYRTNSQNVGAGIFRIEFSRSGLCVDADVAYPPTENDTPADEIPEVPCIVNGMPRFGPLVSLRGKEVTDLVSVLPSTESQEFEIVVPDGTYGYFAYPAALGKASFRDTGSGLTGGWNGATWDEDLNIGDSQGPALVYHTSNNVTTLWYVYRTSWPGLGTFRFQVTFDSPGLPPGFIVEECDTGDTPFFDHGLDEDGEMAVASLASFMPMSFASFAEPLAVEGCVVNGMPRYGSGNHITTGEDILALNGVARSTGTNHFPIRANSGEYGWFAYPAALGKARFADTRNLVYGGWDGARWPEGSIELSTGPVVVDVEIDGVTAPWFLYRTDLPGIGYVTHNVYFESRRLEIGESRPCDLTGVPRPVAYGGELGTSHTVPMYGASAVLVASNAGINSHLTSAMHGRSFQLNVPSGERGYFAYPARLGYANIKSRGAAVAWGGTYGERPTSVYRRVDGQLETWFVYNTKFRGVGNNTYDVTFESELEIGNSNKQYRILAEMTTDRPDLVTFDEQNVAHFAEVYRDTVVQITSTFAGVSTTKSVTIKARGPTLEHIELVVPHSVEGGAPFDVEVIGSYSDGKRYAITTAKIRVVSQYVKSIGGYTVRTNNPLEDTVLHVEATVISSDGSRMVSIQPVILKRVQLELRITDLYIIGPDTITESHTVAYKAHAFFNDGTQQDMLALWESSSSTLVANQSGEITAGSPESEFKAVIKATVQFQGHKYVASKSIEILRSYIVAQSLRIEGPSRILELSNAKFHAFIKWSNGAETRIDPKWSSTRFSITELGVFNAGSVGESVSVEITARALGFTRTAVITVYDTPIDIDYIAIRGSDDIRQGNVSAFRAYAHYSNNREILISPKWSLMAPYAGASIDRNGRLTFTGGRSGILEVLATFDAGTKVFTQTKPVVVVPRVSSLTGLVIQGPSEVVEGTRLNLSATALYQDGSIEPVEPQWGVRSPDPTNFPEVMADIVSPGIFQGRSVETDTIVIIEARYFREIAEYPIVVKPANKPGPSVPLSSRISGPTLLPVSDVGSYVQWVMLDNGCGQEIAMSSEWSIDVDPDIAIIDQNGFLRSINKLDAEVVITAVWECDGNSIESTLDVLIVAQPSTLQALFIRGPDTVLNRTFTTYTMELFRVGQEIVAGEGEIPRSGFTWSVDTIMPGVSVSDLGILYVGDIPDGTQIILRATYVEDSHTISTTAAIIVRAASDPEPEPEPDWDYIPRFGVASGGLTVYEDVMSALSSQMPSSVSGQTFTTNGETLTDYVYFTHPASLGVARFTDVNTGFEGGMDGASWPHDGNIGTEFGPIELTRSVQGQEEIWYLYRSDFPGLGELTLRVTYVPQ